MKQLPLPSNAARSGYLRQLLVRDWRKIISNMRQNIFIFSSAIPSLMTSEPAGILGFLRATHFRRVSLVSPSLGFREPSGRMGPVIAP
jgi:hypothetical protein